MSTTEKLLTLDQLKSGDVLVMQGAQDVSWAKIIADADMDAALIQAIMWLTKSDVCHGAIYYGEHNEIYSLIDDGMEGVGQHGMTHETGQGDWWYVRRMSHNESLQPVLGLAMKYEHVKTAYDWELLTMLGLLLIYKKVSPETAFFQELLSVLKKVVVSLDHLTHKKSVEYFVCSQFVATCFDQAGSDYELQVKNGNLGTEAEVAGVSLLDHCVSYQSLNTGVLKEPITASDEALAVTDIKSMLESNNTQTKNISVSTTTQTRMVSACDQFLNMFFKMNGLVLGLSADDYDSTNKRFELAQKYQADFVTPADLKSHCSNLLPEGMIRFVYGKAMS